MERSAGPAGPKAGGGGELLGVDPRLTKNVVDTLARYGPGDRQLLIETIGVGRSTLSRAVSALLDAGMVVEISTPANGRGRPRSLLAVNPRAGAAIGLQYGLRHVRGAVVDGAHTPTATGERSLEQDYTVVGALDATLSLIDELTARASGPVVGLGLALPGPVDREAMALTRSSILPGWANVPVMQEFADRIPYPVVADNESNLAAYAEKLWGAATDLESMMYLQLHSGVGGAVLMDGRIMRGQHGAAGEFGHLSRDRSGLLCRCGNRGCLEASVGIPHLLATMSQRHGHEVSFAEAVSLIASGDSDCRAVLHKAARRAGRAMGTLCNALDPQCVVVGGSLVAAGEPLFTSLREGFQRAALPMHQGLEIRSASLGRYGAALGATGLVLASGFDRLLAGRR